MLMQVNLSPFSELKNACIQVKCTSSLNTKGSLFNRGRNCVTSFQKDPKRKAHEEGTQPRILELEHSVLSGVGGDYSPDLETSLTWNASLLLPDTPRTAGVTAWGFDG